MQQVQTILADNHQIFIEGVKKVLASVSQKRQIKIIGEFSSGSNLLEALKNETVDLLILELSLPDHDGFEIIDYICKERIDCKVLVFSAYEDPKIVKQAFRKGVDGYILKSRPVEELFTAIEEVLADGNFVGDGVQISGNNVAVKRKFQNRSVSLFADRFMRKYSLTKRELEILKLISQALSNKQIAKELFISDQTVSVHRKNIMRKLGVSNTAGLVKIAYDYSLI
ncbi:MAG: response regulator transcription factor [Saprospiraceae bacterium]|jgi:DNA-binding NarL/FixJ family response regulator|nr:response regulator transcription factor [Saprospiraceae bacterium]